MLIVAGEASADLHGSHLVAALKRLDPGLTFWGIGGSRNPGQLKCLHAHVAFGLAQPGDRIGELILAEVDDPWPADRCCTALEGGAP